MYTDLKMQTVAQEGIGGNNVMGTRIMNWYQKGHPKKSKRITMQGDDQYFETVIIGTGFSGLLAAIRLKKETTDNFCLVRKET